MAAMPSSWRRFSSGAASGACAIATGALIATRAAIRTARTIQQPPWNSGSRNPLYASRRPYKSPPPAQRGSTVGHDLLQFSGCRRTGSVEFARTEVTQRFQGEPELDVFGRAQRAVAQLVAAVDQLEARAIVGIGQTYGLAGGDIVRDVAQLAEGHRVLLGDLHFALQVDAFIRRARRADPLVDLVI